MSTPDELKRDLALERYEADADEIAEAMLRRLTPVNLGPIGPSDAEVERILFADDDVPAPRAA